MTRSRSHLRLVTPYDVVVARRADEAAFRDAVPSVLQAFQIIRIGRLIPGTRAIYASAYVVTEYVGELGFMRRVPYVTYRLVMLDDLGLPHPTFKFSENSRPFTTLTEAQDDLLRRYSEL